MELQVNSVRSPIHSQHPRRDSRVLSRLDNENTKNRVVLMNMKGVQANSSSCRHPDSSPRGASPTSSRELRTSRFSALPCPQRSTTCQRIEVRLFAAFPSGTESRTVRPTATSSSVRQAVRGNRYASLVSRTVRLTEGSALESWQADNGSGEISRTVRLSEHGETPAALPGSVTPPACLALGASPKREHRPWGAQHVASFRISRTVRLIEGPPLWSWQTKKGWGEISRTVRPNELGATSCERSKWERRPWTAHLPALRLSRTVRLISKAAARHEAKAGLASVAEGRSNEQSQARGFRPFASACSRAELRSYMT